MKRLNKIKKRWFIVGIISMLLLACPLFTYAIIDSPVMQARRYEDLKNRYPVYNFFKNPLVSYSNLPEGGYLEHASKTNDLAVLARVTKGNEEVAKTSVVNRMKTNPFATEDDYTLEDITEFLREDPNRLNWGNNCLKYEIDVIEFLYSNVDVKDDSMSVRMNYSENALFRAYTGMEVILFLNEKGTDDNRYYEIDQFYPFYVSEKGYVVPACTLLIGYEEYGGMRVGKFVKEVKHAYK